MPKPVRKLALRRETLVELSADDLRDVVGAAATLAKVCDGQTITVILNGCPTDPAVCHYYSQMC